MRFPWLLAGFSASQLFSNVLAWDPTDSLMDADQMQSGYLPNHNMDPSIVGSSAWGQIWAYKTGFQEQFYAKPLTFTPASTGRQVVLMFSEWNRIYSIDAINGTLVASRDLGLEGEIPFAVSDLGNCNDISDHIGVTGTPVIDNVTETVYFWAKGYNQYGANAATGYANGAYRFHAIDAVTLKEKPGFPNNIQYTPADNDPQKVFIGGIQLQRPSLNLVNGVVFAGFGGHCDQYNYTGWLIGMDAKSGNLLTAYVTSGGAGTPQPDGTWTGGGGGSAIWMGGSMCPSDQSGRVFFVTGNGQKVDINQNLPASGRVQLNTLSEAVVNMGINSTTKKLYQQDYFEPYSYLAMDAGDRDLGSGGFMLLDQKTFVGGGVTRMGMAAGKNGIAYFLNLDNMGGFKLGTGGTDNIIQTINMPSYGAVFAASGSYPLEGGYVYITPIGFPTQVYKLGFTDAGLPQFSWYGQTPDNSTGRPGTGPATVTTYKGQAGTAILWIVDPLVGVKAYNAVPVNGVLTPITLPASVAVSKYQRPGFGNGRYFMGSSNGYIRGYGSPVALPMTCTSPLDFGTLAIGNTYSQNITCTTNIKLYVTGYTGGSSIFKITNSTLPSAAKQLAIGTTFNVTVTFDLATTASSIVPGTQGSSIELLTTNSVTGYAPQEPVGFTGTAVSSNPFLTVSPQQVTFAGIVIGSADAAAGSSSTFVISNAGLTTMNILGMAYVTGSIAAGTEVYHNLTSTAVNGTTTTVFDANGYFTSTNMPVKGQSIAAGGSIIINANFNSGNNQGTFYTTLMVFTDGGNAYSIFTGSASSKPIALFEYSNGEGGWITIDHCSNVTAGCSDEIDFAPSKGLTVQTIQLRFTNTGGSTLTITKSKPNEGAALGAANPETDFAEGMTIAPGASTIASVIFSPPASTLNGADVTYTGTWTLNTDDLTFGVHSVDFVGVLSSNKTGPILANGQAQYLYLGCYLDQVGGVRIESKEYVNTTGNTNGWCQTNALNGGLVFAGTEYMQECYVGNVIPPAAQLYPDSYCSYLCSGDSHQICGGNGGYLSVYYDSTRYFPSNGTIIGTSGLGPQIPKTINNGTWNYAGCYTDSQNARVLTGKALTGSTVSLEVCGTYCAGLGYSIFGVEYADECYCGNTFSKPSTLRPDTECTMQCAANATEFCGAGSRLSLYVKNGTTVPSSAATSSIVKATSTSSASVPSSTGNFISLGCYSDNVNDRTLQSSATTDDAGMTIEECATFCTGHTYFGVEYAQECYCGNSIDPEANITTDGRCSMPCIGNANEICGGNNGINIYSYSNVTTTTTTTKPATTTSAASTATSIPIPPTLNIGTGWTFQSCWNDNTTIRTLKGLYTAPATMTLENCATFCAGYKYFGVEYYSECYCSNTLSYGSAALPISKCNYPCYGNTAEYCGGSGALTLYQNITTSQNSSSSVSSTMKGSSTALSISTTYSTSTKSSSITSVSTSSSSAPSSLTSSKSSSTSSSSISSSLSSSVSLTSTKSSSSSSSSVSSSATSSATSSTSGSSSSSSSSATSTTSSSSDSSLSSSALTTSSSLSTTLSSSSSHTTSDSSSSKSTTSSELSTASSTNSISSITSSPSSSISSTASSTASSVLSTASSSGSSTTSKAVSPSTSTSAASLTSPFSSKPSTGTSTTSSSSSTSARSTTTSSSSSTLRSTTSSSSTARSTTLSSSSSTARPITTSSSSSRSVTSSSSSSGVSATIATSVSAASSPVSSTASANPWTYIGCANDTTSARALSGASYQASTGITIEACQEFCQGQSFPLAGLEYSQECYCGTSLGHNSVLGQTGCTMKCNGNTNEICGGSSRLSMYNNTAYTPPSIKVAVGWQYNGCYTELNNARAIGSMGLQSTSNMTVELCVSTCQGKNLPIAALEYGSQCFCGSSISSNSTKVDDSQCEVMLCPGNQAEYCSAGNRLQTYIMNAPISS